MRVKVPIIFLFALITLSCSEDKQSEQATPQFRTSTNNVATLTQEYNAAVHSSLFQEYLTKSNTFESKFPDSAPYFTSENQMTIM